MSAVDAYIDQVSSERRPALVRLRSLCRELLPSHRECIEYKMPVYKRNGVAEIAFASQKQYISLYVMKKHIVDEHREALAGCSIGKGCIRFTRPDKIDFDVVASLLRRTAQSTEQPC